MNEQQILDECLTAFENQKSAKKKKQAVDCNLNIFHLAKINHRRGEEHFYKNMTFEIRLVRMYLICLSELGLWDFEDSFF